ncbi:uncharacterized protein V1510DRAFT_127234 [Dipodascopsis tothii]|uniref:uncharacterized protein n=1 Tax=Dipodascopsis tothii TaxID=44089 RepID=UPI0034CD7823
MRQRTAAASSCQRPATDLWQSQEGLQRVVALLVHAILRDESCGRDHRRHTLPCRDRFGRLAGGIKQAGRPPPPCLCSARSTARACTTHQDRARQLPNTVGLRLMHEFCTCAHLRPAVFARACLIVPGRRPQRTPLRRHSRRPPAGSARRAGSATVLRRTRAAIVPISAVPEAAGRAPTSSESVVLDRAAQLRTAVRRTAADTVRPRRQSTQCQ